MEDIFEILVSNAVNGRLDCFAKRDEEYRKLDTGLNRAHEEYMKLNLNGRERVIVQEMIDDTTALMSRYAVLAYKLAVKDTVALLKEMGVIGSDISADRQVEL